MTHIWNIKEKITVKEAVEIQRNLKEKINLTRLLKPIQLIGGCDVSMNLFATSGFAGFVTLDYNSFDKVDESILKEKINFPYIPGLLSFREIPMLLNAWNKLKIKPDILVVDGTGIAHPRRMGIATHLGIILQIPTIGCAKNLLTGSYTDPDNTVGATALIYDSKNRKEIIGAAIRTKVGIKPVFVSAGNLITLPECIEIIKKCILKHRLPEPTRLAHITVNEYRVKMSE